MKSPTRSENLILGALLLLSVCLLVGLIWKAGSEMGRPRDFRAEPAAAMGDAEPGL